MGAASGRILRVEQSTVPLQDVCPAGPDCSDLGRLVVFSSDLTFASPFMPLDKPPAYRCPREVDANGPSCPLAGVTLVPIGGPEDPGPDDRRVIISGVGDMEAGSVASNAEEDDTTRDEGSDPTPLQVARQAAETLREPLL